MAYPAHNYWYQSRSIRFARRYAEDRDIQNLHSDGVLEPMNSSIQGPRIAGMQEGQKAAIRKSLNRMEQLLAHMLNILDKQSQNMSELSRQYQADLKQLRTKKLEPKKDLQGAHHKEAVDLDNSDEVVEKEADRTDSDETEVVETEKAEIEAGLTKQHDANLNGVQTHSVEVSQEEFIEKEEEKECTDADEMEFASENDILVTVAAGDHKHLVKGVNEGEDLKSMGQMLTTTAQETVSLDFCKKKFRRRRIGVRRQQRRPKTNGPVVFSVEQTTYSRYARQRRQRRHLRKKLRAARYGEGLGLILGLGIGFTFYHQIRNHIPEFSPLTAMGTNGNLGDTIRVIGGDGADVKEVREESGDGRINSKNVRVVGVCDIRANARGELAKKGVGTASDERSRCVSAMVVAVDQFRARKDKLVHMEKMKSDFYEGYFKAVGIKARGKGVISHIHDNFADVIHLIFCP